MTFDVHASRLLKAASFVLALVLVVPVSGFLATVFPDAGLRSGTAGFHASDVVGANGPLEALKRLESAAERTGAAVPDRFEDEIGFVDGAQDVRVSDDGSVLGYLLDGSSEASLEQVRKLMAGKGWHEVSLGGIQGATFVKAEGSCTWALVTCTQVGNSTSVVVRSVFR